MARCARLPLSGFAIGHAFGLRVQRVQKVQRGRLTALRAEGCGRLSAASCVSLRSGGDSGSVAEGGGGALRAQIIKKPARALRHSDRSGAEWRNLPPLMVRAALRQEIFRLRVSSERFASTPIPAHSPARDDDAGGHHWTHLRCEGSEGSEGSKGSEGGGGD